MDTSTFAQKIKAKYPAYQNVDDATLVKKFIEKYPEYKSQVNVQSETGADISQTGSAIVNTVNKGVDKYNEIQARQDAGTQSGLRTKLQQLGVGAGTASGVIGDVLTGAIKTVLPQSGENLVKQGLSEGMKGLADLTNRYDEIKNTNPTLAFGINTALGFTPDAALTVKDLMSGYEKLKVTNPKVAQDIDSALGFVQLGLDVTGIGETAGLAKNVAKKGFQLGKTSANKVVGAADDIAGGGMKLAGDSKTKLMEFIAPEIDKKVAVVLEKTPTVKFNEMENIAKLASENFDNPSAFEVVSNKIADSAEQINGQVKSLSQQKKSIISKAKNGSTDFTKETGETILDINRSLKGSTTGKSFIQKLKGVKTKIDADNVIDEMQDILYKGNKDMTIPVGSKEDMVLKGIIGKYNGKLKQGLPTAYANLNTKISERLSSLDDLNKALGETIEGVPVRGASLVKQYFSPSGTKARQLFDFIKKTTGYNPAEDAVLAKYMSEVYGDTRTRSLLQGIPTSTTGAVEKIIDFAVEKTGLGGALQESVKQGGITKARKLTNPAK